MLKIYRAVQIVLLVGILISLILLLKRPQRLQVQQVVPPVAQAAAADSFQTKLGELEQAHANGQTGLEAHISSQEVAAALAAANPQTANQQVPSAQPAQPGSAQQSSTTDDLNANTSLSPDQVAVTDQQVVFDGDQVKGQFTTKLAGKDVVVTFSGRLGSKNGYVDFVPTSFQVGSMPIPAALVQEAFEKKILNDASTRDKLKLPDYVSDLKIENGQLVLVEK
ncbi:MAG: hypothetical protein JOZ10_02260 [Acidobacteria bacterium]|nr:hypothetical protein [Acidobacteriota bacterium]MBV9146207.1 hypothetical protein [Acidobacteriota bacterium]MBV9437487.1 hypothetical protein [Acidobacteriota bacterium]